MLKQGFKEDRCESGIWASLNGRTLEILSSVHFRIICSDPVLAGVPSPEVLCSLGFLGWLGETFHEEMVGGTVCSRWAKTMIVSVVPFYDLQDLMQISPLKIYVYVPNPNLFLKNLFSTVWHFTQTNILGFTVWFHIFLKMISSFLSYLIISRLVQLIFIYKTGV